MEVRRKNLSHLFFIRRLGNREQGIGNREEGRGNGEEGTGNGCPFSNSELELLLVEIYELGIRPLRVVATHRKATKPSDCEAKWESGKSLYRGTGSTAKESLELGWIKTFSPLLYD